MLPRKTLRRRYFPTQGKTATSDVSRLGDKAGFYRSGTGGLRAKHEVVRANARKLSRIRRNQSSPKDSTLGQIRLGLSTTLSQEARFSALGSPPKAGNLSSRSASTIHPLSAWKTPRIHSQILVSARARKPLGKLATDLRHLMKPVLRNLYLQAIS